MCVPFPWKKSARAAVTATSSAPISHSHIAFQHVPRFIIRVMHVHGASAARFRELPPRRAIRNQNENINRSEPLLPASERAQL